MYCYLYHSRTLLNTNPVAKWIVHLLSTYYQVACGSFFSVILVLDLYADTPPLETLMEVPLHVRRMQLFKVGTRMDIKFWYEKKEHFPNTHSLHTSSLKQGISLK